MDELAKEDTVFLARFLPRGSLPQIDLTPLTHELKTIASLPRAASPELVDLARRSLTKLDRIQHEVTLADISRHIEDHFRLRPGALRQRRRDQRTAFARQLGMYLCREVTNAPLRSIAKHFRRNHSTTLYGLKLIQRRTKVDAAFRRRLAQLATHLSDSSSATGQISKSNGYHAESIGERVTKNKEGLYGTQTLNHARGAHTDDAGRGRRVRGDQRPAGRSDHHDVHELH